jgi:lipooligosaccharide transport system permease protein
MGVGLGGLVDARGALLPGAGSYLHFLAPGLLAAACMQTASSESSWPVTGKMVWRRNYEAMIAAPLTIPDLVLGELVWIGIRLLTVALAFAIVMDRFGVVTSPSVLPGAVGAAVLTGLAFSAPIIAYAATLKTGGEFNVLFRFGITPLFLFSGVFFPIDRLPGPLRLLAWATPLFHGVELVRGLALESLDAATATIHVAYLLSMLAIGLLVAQRTFRRRLCT